MTESFPHFAVALALKPKDINTRRLLAIAYGRCGRLEEGRKLLRDWLEQEPDNADARHFLAAYGGTDIPDRASDRYMEEEFDNFAKSFDAKLASLDYRVPKWVGEAVTRLLGAPDRRQGILDIGCGTGLCDPYLRPYARYLRAWICRPKCGNLRTRAVSTTSWSSPNWWPSFKAATCNWTSSCRPTR